MGLSAFRKHVANIEQRQFQDIAQVLFVFFSSQSSQWATAVRYNVGAISFRDRIIQTVEQRLAIRIGQRCGVRWHLAGLDAIVNQNPAIAQLPVVKREGQ